ncbi:unnamed protein product [Didymodactylos carnosus]|uniref:MACPF domain-containing protein n=1 Tax=Didymodactylos carnosus TaxID=1234261 RepID=A0A815VVM0_9BILA|nr:unnamed protein product [Didymodactylos carnosus]CAF1533860.1 unnamed protein product [Didymodactylos carnosus]CAF3952456.1 unnamed protein product [Didymodactylos carnosus]CAF4393492.1 unnamed protein product [Didymodactylos carnosus]
MDLSFSYKHSEQTKYMVDNMVKKQYEILYTSAKISLVKLSMFEPSMALSTQFRMVMDNMPCCTYSKEAEKYIFDYIFGYFGFAYVTEIMLGGIAQQNMFIDQVNITTIEQKGYERSDEAQIEFYVKLNVKDTYKYDKTKHDEFMKYVKDTYVTILGGDTHIQTLDEWQRRLK